MFIGATAHAVIPNIEPNQPLTAWAYDNLDEKGTKQAHTFFSNGDYCFVAGNFMQMGSLTGTWQKQDDKIVVKAKPTNAVIWGRWDVAPDTRPTIIITFSMLAQFQAPFWVGFGTDVPHQIKVYDAERDDNVMPIPPNSTHLFVGEYQKGKTQLLLSRLPLDRTHLSNIKTLTVDKGEAYRLRVKTLPNALKHAPNEFMAEYKVVNDELSANFKMTDKFKIIANSTNPLPRLMKIEEQAKLTDIQNKCRLDFANEDKLQNPTIVTSDVIEWQGTQ